MKTTITRKHWKFIHGKWSCNLHDINPFLSFKQLSVEEIEFKFGNCINHPCPYCKLYGGFAYYGKDVSNRKHCFNHTACDNAIWVYE